MIKKIFLVAFVSLAAVQVSHSYPTSIKGTVDLNISQGSDGFAITSDDKKLIVAKAKTINIVDLETLALSSEQPIDISEDTDTNFNIGGISYVTSGNYIFASQSSGNMLRYSLSDLATSPTIISIDANKNLSQVIRGDIGSNSNLYILDDANSVVFIFDNNSQTVSANIDLKPAVPANIAFHITDMLFVPETLELYMATDSGRIFYMNESGLGLTSIDIDAVNGNDIAGLAVTPDGSKLYAIDSTDDVVLVISTSSHTVIDTIDPEGENTALQFIAVSEVSIPTGVYGFVSGENGITVFDTSNDEILDQDTSTNDLDPIATTLSGPMLPSDDGYIYMSTEGGEIAVLTDRPFISVTNTSYTDSAGEPSTTLQSGGTVAITFTSDESGTYNVRANGDITGDGILLTDTNGDTSGSVTASASTVISFAYDTNASSLEEGDNKFFIFVTDSDDLTGRLATEVTVDLPPEAVTIDSTGFGDGRIYVTFSRLSVSDIDHYNIYVDEDATIVQTKTEIAEQINQPATGDTVTATVTGLTNGTTYYIAVEAVDETSQTGARSNVASAVPQNTVSLIEMSGEAGGCSLIRK